MKCPRCQVENAVGARFCEDCGARLEAACPSCGTPVTPGKKFCRSCGAALTTEPADRFASPESYTPKHLAEKILTSKAALEGERKQVTVLFADLKGSMELLADRDPEDARKLLDPVLEHMMEAVHRYEGTVNQVMGDGIMALFGAPLAHEDHAVRACYAALRMQESVKRMPRRCDARTACRAPDPCRPELRRGRRARDRQRSAHGLHRRRPDDPSGRPHGADRRSRLHPPLRRRRCGSPRATFRSKPLGERDGQGPGRAGRGLRDRRGERRALAAACGCRSGPHALRRARQRAGAAAPGARARAPGHGQVVAVVGEPGVGKSRLYWEFTHSHRTAGLAILESSSVSYGKATAFLPDRRPAPGLLPDRSAGRRAEIREKVTGKLLSLDRALEPSLPALLWLLDVPVEDASVGAARSRRSGASGRSTA